MGIESRYPKGIDFKLLLSRKISNVCYYVTFILVTPYSLQQILAEHGETTHRRMCDLLEQKRYQTLPILSINPHLPNVTKSTEPEDDELW